MANRKIVEKYVEQNFLLKEFYDLENDVKHGRNVRKNMTGWFETDE